MNKHDIDRLDRGIAQFRANLAALDTTDDYEELIQLWRQEYWTTPAEYLLVAGTIDSMVALTQHLADVRNVLIEGSRLVGTGG